jgi:hypothetical protein
VKDYVADMVNQLLNKFGQIFPSETEINLPELKEIKIDWKRYRVPIDYSSLPLQDAVHLVSFLVMIQAGKSRFAHGVPTVGGRFHVGVVTKGEGFRRLNEPELTHRFTGFGDDVR